MKKVLLVTDTWAPQVNGVVTTWKNLINYSDRQSVSFEILHPFLFKSFAWPFYKEIRLPLVSYKTIENKHYGILADYTIKLVMILFDPSFSSINLSVFL